MGKPTKDMFDPKHFLAKVSAGKTILELHKNQHVFEQGDVADTVFYIQAAGGHCKSAARLKLIAETIPEGACGYFYATCRADPTRLFAAGRLPRIGPSARRSTFHRNR